MVGRDQVPSVNDRAFVKSFSRIHGVSPQVILPACSLLYFRLKWVAMSSGLDVDPIRDMVMSIK